MKTTLSVGRLAAVTVGLLLIATGIAWYIGLFAALRPSMHANAIMVIAPTASMARGFLTIRRPGLFANRSWRAFPR